MTLARQRTGRIGEGRACDYLADRGMVILARNCRTRAGEIDAVGMDRGTLTFIEVKTMRTGARSGPERPVFAVGPRKQLQIRRLARAWLAENQAPRYSAIRFDVVGVTLDPTGSPMAIEHIADAF